MRCAGQRRGAEPGVGRERRELRHALGRRRKREGRQRGGEEKAEKGGEAERTRGGEAERGGEEAEEAEEARERRRGRLQRAPKRA